MVYCVAFGCKNDSRKNKEFSYYRFPKDSKLRDVWLAKIARENVPDVNSKDTVLCSEHFEAHCFERDLKAELLCLKPKRLLKSDAVPSLFVHRSPPSKRRRITSEKRQVAKEKQEYLSSIFTSTEACSSSSAISSSDPDQINTVLNETTSTTCETQCDPIPTCIPVEETTEKYKCQAIQATVDLHNKECQVNTLGDRLLRKSVATQTTNSFREIGIQTDLLVTEEEDTKDDDDIIDSSQETAYQSDSKFLSPQKDRLHSLLSEGTSETESTDEEIVQEQVLLQPQEDMKYIVFEQKLDELLQRCPQCGSIVVEKEKDTKGTLLTITLSCINHHSYTWHSQPLLNKMAAGNLLLPASILLSGATYTKLATVADILNLQFLSEKTFCDIQNEYLFPVINDFWKAEQESVFSEVGERSLWLSGDGRCDSPGFSAKYGTYSMVDQQNDKVVDFHVIHVGEVNNSNAMEREGFKRCMEAIAERGVDVEVVATDGHIGIAADIRNNYPQVNHQLDVWHLAKRVKSKLTEKAKKKDCTELFPWIKSVSNHLWWCAQTCDDNPDLLVEKWISIVHHAANFHSWDSAELYHECPHPPIPDDAARRKRWLKRESEAHKALVKVVFDKTLLTNIRKLTKSCHTGSLEVYHSVQTSYVPKRQHFSYKGMVARTQLAALHHNANVGRQQAVTATGEPRYKIAFPKMTKEWVAKPIYEKTTRVHLTPMLDAIVERKQQRKEDRSEGIDDSNIASNIAAVPRPPKEEVIARRTSRFAQV